MSSIGKRINLTQNIHGLIYKYMKAKKQMTIDDLASVVQKEFHEMRRNMVTKDMVKDMVTKDMIANMATKDMLKDLATKDMLKDMVTKDMLQLVVEGMDMIREDIRDIKITLGPLVRMVAALDTDVQHLMTRVARLEQKSGFVKS